MSLSRYKICIIKIGSAIIAGDGEHIDDSVLKDVCRQVAELRRLNWRSVVVTSGATVSGRTVLEGYRSPLAEQPNSTISVSEKRVLSAIGQSQLISRYASFLNDCEPSLIAAQVLLTRQALADRENYNLIRQTLVSMLEHEIVPIINENDPVNSDTAKFADNDQIAAYVGGMLDAAHVVFISDAGGVYDKNPKLHEDAKRITMLPFDISTWPSIAVDDRLSSFGGMSGKLEALRLLNILGIPSHVVSKLHADAIVRSITGIEEFGTRVEPLLKRHMSSLKRWLSTGANSKGIVIVSDRGAEVFSKKATHGKAVSLLGVGVMACHGSFEKGDAVTLRDREYDVVGVGRTRFSSREIVSLCNIIEPEYKSAKLNVDRALTSSPGARSAIIVHNDQMIPASGACFVDLNDRQLISSVALRMKLSGYKLRPLGNKTMIGGANAQQLPEISFEGKNNQDLWWHARKVAKRIGVVAEDWILFSCLTEEGLFDGRSLSEENSAAVERVSS
jgi:glutamate 5-kinase